MGEEMKLILAFAYLLLLFCVSFISVNNEDKLVENRPTFTVYWNVPTFQCHTHGFNFSSVSSWGIKQNVKDEFRGDVISILYDPGEYPALLEAPSNGNVPRNGGVPQEGSLSHHLSILKSHLEKLIPRNFEGLGVIDFEHWRAIWHQNWGSLNVYRVYSKAIEKRRHPFWFPSLVEKEAIYRFELAAKMFLLQSLQFAKQMYPKAKWGYYGYPFCFNYSPHNYKETCAAQVQQDNDGMTWLFNETTGYYPSLYLKERDMGTLTRRKYIRGRIRESMRIAKGSSVYPYIWYKYHDSKRFLTQEDMIDVIGAPKEKGCDGVVIWGSSKDVNTPQKCKDLADYVDNVLGPAVAQVNAALYEDEFESTTQVMTDVPTTEIPTTSEDPTTTEESRQETTTIETITYRPQAEEEHVQEEEEEEEEEDEEDEEKDEDEEMEGPEEYEYEERKRVNITSSLYKTNLINKIRINSKFKTYVN